MLSCVDGLIAQLDQTTSLSPPLVPLLSASATTSRSTTLTTTEGHRHGLDFMSCPSFLRLNFTSASARLHVGLDSHDFWWGNLGSFIAAWPFSSLFTVSLLYPNAHYIYTYHVTICFIHCFCVFTSMGHKSRTYLLLACQGCCNVEWAGILCANHNTGYAACTPQITRHQKEKGWHALVIGSLGNR